MCTPPPSPPAVISVTIMFTLLIPGLGSFSRAFRQYLVTDSIMGTAYMVLAPCTDTARTASLPKARQPRTIQILEADQLQVTRIRQVLMREFPASKRHGGKP